jgi:hypothetical protein
MVWSGGMGSVMATGLTRVGRGQGTSCRRLAGVGGEHRAQGGRGAGSWRVRFAFYGRVSTEDWQDPVQQVSGRAGLGAATGC